MVLRGLAAVASVLVVVTLATACTDTVNDSEEPSSALAALPEAPAAPPAVTMQGVPIDPVYYDWIVDEEQVIYKQAPDQDDIVLPGVPVKSTGKLEIVISAEALPADFIVVLFDEVDANGVPIDPDGVSTDCLHDEACELSQSGDRIKATLHVAETFQVAVVQLLYATESLEGEGLTHINGSWGAALEHEE